MVPAARPAVAAATTARTTGPTTARAMRTMRFRSPEVLSDGRVTFRLNAPRASEVVFVGMWAEGRQAMVRQPDGTWSVTVGPLGPGVWEYSFSVDGLEMLDPANPSIKPMREPRVSLLYVSGQPPLLHDFQDVPHGVLRQHTYFSKSVGARREMIVYTPPGYDQNPQTQYPTLYLLHGSGDNQATWTVVGKAHWTLDNLIAQGRAKPMVVVMVDGHAGPGGGYGVGGGGLFDRDLIEDVMPLIQSSYRVRTDPASCAITGTSMGGFQALVIGLNNLDRFAYIGSFSGAMPSPQAIDAVLRDPAATNQKIKLLWIACGTEDFLFPRNEQFVDLLKQSGIHYEWHVMAAGHGWWPWRTTYLNQFVTRLWQ